MGGDNNLNTAATLSKDLKDINPLKLRHRVPERPGEQSTSQGAISFAAVTRILCKLESERFFADTLTCFAPKPGTNTTQQGQCG